MTVSILLFVNSYNSDHLLGSYWSIVLNPSFVLTHLSLQHLSLQQSCGQVFLTSSYRWRTWGPEQEVVAQALQCAPPQGDWLQNPSLNQTIALPLYAPLPGLVSGTTYIFRISCIWHQSEPEFSCCEPGNFTNNSRLISNSSPYILFSSPKSLCCKVFHLDCWPGSQLLKAEETGSSTAPGLSELFIIHHRSNGLMWLKRIKCQRESLFITPLLLICLLIDTGTHGMAG